MPKIRQKNKTKTEHGEVTNAQYERIAARRNAVLDSMIGRRLIKSARSSARTETARREGIKRDRSTNGEYRPFGMPRQG